MRVPEAKTFYRASINSVWGRQDFDLYRRRHKLIARTFFMTFRRGIFYSKFLLSRNVRSPFFAAPFGLIIIYDYIDYVAKVQTNKFGSNESSWAAIGGNLYWILIVDRKWTNSSLVVSTTRTWIMESICLTCCWRSHNVVRLMERKCLLWDDASSISSFPLFFRLREPDERFAPAGHDRKSSTMRWR